MLKLPAAYLATTLLCLLLNASDTLAKECGQFGDIEQFCGFPSPEDMAIMPDGNHLLLSPFGGITGEHPQSFHLFDPRTGEATPIPYLTDNSPERWDGGKCPSPASVELGSHGISLDQRTDDRWQLLAVNHSRETVEMYEIIGNELTWRGCVTFPPQANLNDVAALPDGGFVVTHMLDRRDDISLIESFADENSVGHVWRWHPESGLSILPGSTSAVPNGIIVSPDGRYVFIAESLGGQVKKLDLQSGLTLGSVDAPSADNMSWTAAGKLLITGINGELPADCILGSPNPCMAPFKVQAIDPDTMEAIEIWQQNGPPMGAGTVALEYRNHIYIGTAWGSQMIRIPTNQTGFARQ